MSGIPAETISTSGYVSRRSALKKAAALAAIAVVGRVEAADPPAQAYIENTCNLVRLPGGRRLAYAEFGDPNGQQIVIYHHGFQSCRLAAHRFRDALLARPGVRMLAIDRPGTGQSDPDPNLTFHSWPNDLAAFAAALRLDRFSLIGFSGGSPFTLAVARAMPDRVLRVALAGPMAPLEALRASQHGSGRGATFALRHPIVATAALGQYAAAVQRNPRRSPGAATLGPADRDHLANPAVRETFLTVFTEAYRQGSAEIARSAALLAQPWSCWLKDVRTKVNMFQGCCDRVTPPAMAQYLAAALPDATLQLFAGEGHLTIGWNHAAEILAGALS